MAAPLIRTLQAQGGSFYAFSSAARDQTRSNNNPQLKFEFSKFALLNLPNIETPLQKQNYIQFRSIDGSIFNGLKDDDNVNLAESLQNYALNLESLLLSDNDYDNITKQSAAERIFFKWLKEIGAIRFREATTVEKNAAITEKRFVEENTQTSGQRRYQRVVEYVGAIDAINHVDKAGQSYQEVYINVPTRVGNTPTVLFKTLSDTNYQPNMIISPGNSEFIDGRNSSTIHPDGLDIFAFYDYDAAVNYTDADANWHGSSKTDAYYTELLTFEDPSNLEITKFQSDYGGLVQPFTSVSYLRSKLDGISIDFDDESYADIIIDPKIQSIQEYNSTAKAKNFEFNVILVYYDLFDVSNPDAKSTNLYGVIFVNNVTPTIQGGYIDRIKKVKQNPVTGLNGNSYGLKLNLKVDNSIENAGVVTVINDYTTFSMDLFIDASVQLQEAAKTLMTLEDNFNSVINRVDELENLIFSSSNVTEIKSELSDLRAYIENSNIALNDASALVDLIAKNSDDINAIISGQIPVNLQYNTDVISPGDGIAIDKSVPNKIKIESKNQKYILNKIYKEDTFVTSIDSTNPLDLNQNNIKSYIKLKSFTNMVRVNVQNTALSNLKIFIDDQGIRFKEGQVLRLVFDTPISLNGNNILIYTDKLNKFGQGILNFPVAAVAASELMTSKPIIEITCLDEVNYVFAIDILR